MSDIIERLEQVAKFKAGDQIEGFGPNEWGVTLSKLCADASTEIETLRAQLASIRQVAGTVSLESGLTFDAIKSVISARLPHDQ